VNARLSRGPATDRLTDYRRMVAALATAAARCTADLAAAERAYLAGVATATAERAAAQDDAARAERRTARAAAAVVDTDLAVERLWRELRRALRWRGALLGDPPAPATDITPPPAAATAPAGHDELLTHTARRIAALRGRRPGDRPTGRVRPLPRALLPVLPVLGAAAASVAALVAGGLVTLGQGAGPVPTAVRLTGYAAFLVAPFTGIPVATAAGRRLRRGIDAGAIALVVLGGMVAGCVISVALR
jgi:hypothetical protein